MPEPLAYGMTALAALLGLSAKTIHRMIGAGLFPRPIYPTEGKPLWTAEQVNVWLRAKEAGLIPPLPRKPRQEKSGRTGKAPKGLGRENSESEE